MYHLDCQMLPNTCLTLLWLSENFFLSRLYTASISNHISGFESTKDIPLSKKFLLLPQYQNQQSYSLRYLQTKRNCFRQLPFHQATSLIFSYAIVFLVFFGMLHNGIIIIVVILPALNYIHFVPPPPRILKYSSSRLCSFLSFVMF